MLIGIRLCQHLRGRDEGERQQGAARRGLQEEEGDVGIVHWLSLGIGFEGVTHGNNFFQLISYFGRKSPYLCF